LKKRACHAASWAANERLGQAIRRAIDADAAVALNYQMSDALLLQREQWIQRLTPPQIRQHAGLG
jgi:hypothetical protein